MMHKALFLALLLAGLGAAQNLDDPTREVLQKPDEVVRLAGLTEGMTVADIGAGSGYFESRLSRSVGPSGRVLAIDIDPQLIAGMRKRFTKEGLVNVETRLATANDPGLEPQSVDRILLVDTWHHLQNRPVFAQTLGRALRPGGLLVIVDYTLDAPQGPPASLRVSPEALSEELEAAGYAPRLVPETLPNQYIVTAGQR